MKVRFTSSLLIEADHLHVFLKIKGRTKDSYINVFNVGIFAMRIFTRQLYLLCGKNTGMNFVCCTVNYSVI